MRKFKLPAGLIALLALLFISASGFASTAKSGTYVYDEADLLSETFISQLNDRIASIRDNIQSDVLVVYTNDDSQTDARSAAETIINTWVSRGNGYGEKHETVLFYVNMADRSYFIDEYNDANEFRLSYDEIDEMKYTVEEDLRRGSYDGAALDFTTLAEQNMKPGFFQRVWSWILMGLLGGGAAMGIAKGSHNNVTGVPISFYRRREIEDRGSNDIFTGTTSMVRRIDQNRPPQNMGGSGMSGGGPGMTTGAGSSGHQGGGGHF